jgi:hypothetical protein
MGLPYGGKFDYKKTWTSPHLAHDRGSAVDVATAAGQCPSAYVVIFPNTFLDICINMFHAKPYPISQIDPLDVHCNWVDPATYPH